MLYQNNSYHSWSNRSGPDNTIFIDYSTSDDCCTWTSVAQSVLSPESGKWDYPRVQSSSVLIDGNTYHLWYSGGVFYKWRIGYASSTDGIIWTKHKDNPVIQPGSAGSWEETYVAFGSVLFDTVNSVYKMWYYGGKNAYEGNIGYAESTVPSGVSRNNFSGQTRIYPNPAGDMINVHSDGSGEFSIEIIATNGQLIHSAVMEGTNKQIDLSSFQKGVYFITIRSKDFVTTRKIIKL
jgi:hypothetical protein